MVRAQPQCAIADLANRIDLVVHDAAGTEWAQARTGYAEKACRSTSQNPAIAPLAQAEERDVVQMGRLVHALEPGGAANIESPIRRGPDLSFPILQNR